MPIFNDSDWRALRSSEFSGHYGSFGIKILIAGRKLDGIDLDSRAISIAAMTAVDKVEKAIMEAVIAVDPEDQKHRVTERAQIVGLFGSRAIYVEEIPNGYDPDSAYSKHRPWFVITTSVGRFTVGWRKRVINIDWSATVGTKTAEELFAAETVTKGERL